MVDYEHVTAVTTARAVVAFVLTSKTHSTQHTYSLTVQCKPKDAVAEIVFPAVIVPDQGCTLIAEVRTV